MLSVSPFGLFGDGKLKAVIQRNMTFTRNLQTFLSCDISYLMTEEEAFITEASEQFGNRGAKQAQQILEQAAAMFAGGELSDEDKTAFMDEIQSLYLDSKRRAKKFTPKKYLDAK